VDALPYDLSPEEDDGAAGALLGAAAGVLDAVPLDDEEEDEDALEDEPPPPPSFFVEPYRSEYQPPPLRWKAERLTCLLSVLWAPHAEHTAGAGSDIFWMTSRVFPQAEQPYS
jgi:hypothetical protein